MLNRITLTGRMTRIPELRYTQSNIAVTNFSIANQRNYKSGGQTGERDTDFFEVVAWRSTAEFVTKFFTKGSMITVDGRLETRKYTDKEGNKRTAVEIVADNVYFGDSKGSDQKDDIDTAAVPAGVVVSDFVPDFSSAGGGNDFEEITDDGESAFSFPPFNG